MKTQQHQGSRAALQAAPSQQIILRRDEAQDCWTAQRVGDRQTIALFGTDVLPTPFRASCPAETVRAAIARINPDALVEVA